MESRKSNNRGQGAVLSSKRDAVAQQASYTVGQVSSMTGLSVRTLHHYEQIGLVEPARGTNQYRKYSAGDLARLQHVMLYRDCGMQLSDIKVLLDDPGFDTVSALEQHLAALENRQRELASLIATVRKTIDAEKGGITMSDKDRFEGLKRAAIDANELQYGKEARAAYGDAAVDAANSAMLSMDEDEWNNMNDLERNIIDRLSALLQDVNPSEEGKAELAEMHAKWIATKWGEAAYSREAHRALAHGYLADDRFVQYYDSQAGEGATALLVEILEGHLR